jgi:hypothetical protein
LSKTAGSKVAPPSPEVANGYVRCAVQSAIRFPSESNSALREEDVPISRARIKGVDMGKKGSDEKWITNPWAKATRRGGAP